MRAFLKAACIRALRTMAECALAYIGTATMLDEVSWLRVLSCAAMGAVTSLLMAAATGLPELTETSGAGGTEG